MEKSSNISKKIAHRTWNILRLSLPWARNGGLFRNKHNGLAINLRVFGSKLTRKLIHHHSDSRRETRGALAFGDHELSFDETPIFHVKMRRREYASTSLRFKLPCIWPQVDFDCDEDFFRREEDEMCDVEADEETNGDCEIDFKAEEFIAKFHEQMKLQRETSMARLKA